MTFRKPWLLRKTRLHETMTFKETMTLQETTVFYGDHDSPGNHASS